MEEQSTREAKTGGEARETSRSKWFMLADVLDRLRRRWAGKGEGIFAALGSLVLFSVLFLDSRLRLSEALLLSGSKGVFVLMLGGRARSKEVVRERREGVKSLARHKAIINCVT